MSLPKGWTLTPHRAAVHLPSGTAVVADLHLGYAAHRQALGEAIPQWSESAVMHRLWQLCEDMKIVRLVIAGDLVERGATGLAAAQTFIAQGKQLGLEMILVEGNHDRGLPEIPGLQRIKEEWHMAGIVIRHQVNEPAARFTMSGHWHPVLRAGVDGDSLPCYLTADRALILPAQSEDASGVNVLHQPGLRAMHCHAIVADQVLSLGPVRELKQRLPRAARHWPLKSQNQ